MLLDSLTTAFRQRFPEIAFAFGIPPDAIVTLDSPCPEVGTLTIYDDGDEAMVAISEITHSHFASYDETLSANERLNVVLVEVVDFVSALLADQVLLYRDPTSQMGGWQTLDELLNPRDLEHGCEYFVWSRPVRASEGLTGRS